MLYFLIIVLPVVIGILYLIHRNNKLKKIYNTVFNYIQKIYLFEKTQELSDIEKISSGFIVRTEGIQKLENAIVKLEIHLNIKYKVISKTYTPKLEMLKNISKRVIKVEKQLMKNKIINNE